MSRRRHIPTSLTLGAFLVLLSTPLWAQSGVLRGTVVDDEGSPVQGVQITVTAEKLSSYRKTLLSDEDGEFRLRFLKNQLQYRFDILFEKPGYQSFRQPVAPSATQQMRERFVMEPSQTEVVESHGDLGSVVTGSTNVAIVAFNAGLSAQRAGDLNAARAKLEEAVAADGTLGPAQIALAQVRLDQKEYAGAVDAADRALELAASRAEGLKVKHQALRALGRNEEAAAIAEELKEADDDEAAARLVYNEGGEAFQAGDRSTALDRFQQAAELDPSLTDAHHAIATLQLAEGNHEDAAEAAERALALGSEDVRTLRVLYDAYDALGRSDELTEIAPRLAAVDPDFGGSKLIEQAAALWNAGQAEKAVAFSRLALTIDPKLAKAYYFIGLDHIAGGRSSEAKAALQRFIELAPDDPEVPTAKEMIAYLQ